MPNDDEPPQVEPPRELLPEAEADALDLFLGAPRQSGHLATARRDGTPQLGPVWFYWTRPTIWVVTFKTSARVRNVARQPRVAFSVDANRFPATGAVLYGTAESVPMSDGPLERILERYLPRERVPTYVERYRRDPNRTFLRVDVDRVLGWSA